MPLDLFPIQKIIEVAEADWESIKQKLEEEGSFNKIYDPNLDGYFDASIITSGIFSIDRIPDLPRSKISDFWDAPFWDNIPDKPDVHKIKTSGSDDSPDYLSSKLDADVFEEDTVNYVMKLKDGITEHISFASGFGVKFNASSSDPNDKDKLIKGDSYTGVGIYYYDGSSWVKGDFNCNKLNAQNGIVSGGNLNLSEQEAVNFVIENQETLPSTSKAGRIVFNTSDNHLYVYVP